MKDLFADLRAVVSRISGSNLKRDKVLRQVKAYEKDMKRAGIDPAKISQLDFVKPLAANEATIEEWMFRLCVVRLLRGDFSDWTGWE